MDKLDDFEICLLICMIIDLYAEKNKSDMLGYDAIYYLTYRKIKLLEKILSLYGEEKE